jgi:RNA polymerase sigma factor (sigma-70 family)
MSGDSRLERPSKNRSFATTQWSVVVRAGQGVSPESHQALADLCQTYWYPLYAYVRRRGHQAAEAQDLVQSFFAELLDKKRLRLADRERGRFRSFLLTAFQHFLANQSRAARAQKRGGDRQILQLDFNAAETRYGAEPSHGWTAERIFQRRWAMTLLENAVQELRDNYARTGRPDLFEHLKDFVGGGPNTPPYRELGARLGMSEGAVKVAVHRLRQRCRDLLRRKIADTVSDPQEIDEELQAFFAALEG